ncbi:MAG TPA: EAL domain-containing protein [Acidimicrobiales bacterium]|nr:EAL domain-containing protein [Acidimicrobiales bacterium]
MSAGEPGGPEAVVASSWSGHPSEITTTGRPSKRAGLSPYILGYAMGPAALATLLFLRRFGVVAHVPVWLWLVVFAAIPAGSVALEFLCRRHPSTLWLNARVAWHAAAVTAVIYLSGWGPVLTAAFAFVALENVSHDGSRTWRRTALWSLLGIAVGQVAIWQHWAPSFLSVGKSEALGLMGAFVLLFVIRMAGATIEQKEDAETSMRVSEERFRSLVQNSTDTTFVMGAEGRIFYASPATLSLFGRNPEDVLGLRATELVHREDRPRVEAQLSALINSVTVTEPIQFRVEHADGTYRFAEAVVSNLRDNPSVAGYVGNLRDITERKEAESQLLHVALHDPLTGLPNRTLILDRADQMLVRSRREYRPVAAMFVDLDNFKDINDSLGHDAGDKVLQAVARRFVGILRESDTVGRLGGDEFVVLAEGASLGAGPEMVAERLHDALREPFEIEGYASVSLTVTASIGIAGGQRNSASELLRDADIALYRAKALGKNRSALFQPEMQTAVLDRIELDADLRCALAEEQFFLLYQPVFDLDHVRVSGVEALVRWRHPVRGVVPPDQFIPMLEDSGLIVDVGRWVLFEACRQAAQWHRRGFKLSMSVNVSMRQLEIHAFVDHIKEALAETGLDPTTLVIEITESTLMRDADATVRRLREIKDLGVQVAIDDFGTGYSSLAYLRQFPVDALKIDRSFIAAMADSPESGALIHTLVELGRTLGLETLAEGIEDNDQLAKLQAEQCDRGQGFLFSKPIEAEAIEAFLLEAAESSRAAAIAPPTPAQAELSPGTSATTEPSVLASGIGSNS